MKKNVITVFALFCAGLSTYSFAGSITETKDYQSCLQSMQTSWKDEQDRYSQLVNFNKSLDDLAKTGFTQTSNCMKNISKLSLNSGFFVPGFSDVISGLINNIDSKIAGLCDSALMKVEGEANAIIKQKVSIDLGDYSSVLKGKKVGANVGIKR